MHIPVESVTVARHGQTIVDVVSRWCINVVGRHGCLPDINVGGEVSFWTKHNIIAV